MWGRTHNPQAQPEGPEPWQGMALGVHPWRMPCSPSRTGTLAHTHARPLAQAHPPAGTLHIPGTAAPSVLSPPSCPGGGR